MELIVINENKLKISMSKTDMQHYGLDENEFYCSVTNTRGILKNILHNSPIRTGFENISTDDKILIQLYPEKSGGCELYVTRITLDESEDDLFMPYENEERYLLPKSMAKKQINKTTLVCYKFDKLEYSTKAAKIMKNIKYSGASSFYRDLEGKYFLFVNAPKNEYQIDTGAIELLSEFGDSVNAEHTRLSVAERGICIFKENAIENLADF